MKFYNVNDLSFKAVSNHQSFEDLKGARYTCFYYLTSDLDNDKVVGVTFKKITKPTESLYRSSGGRTYVYHYIIGEGLYRGDRLVNKAKVLPQDVHEYLFNLVQEVL